MSRHLSDPPGPGGLCFADASQSDRLCFDRFVLTPGERLLTKDNTPVAIGGRGFDLLRALVEQAGRVVAKRDLMRAVWPDVVVEDATLRFHMTRLRKVLADGTRGVRLIATQVGVGYAFVGTVQRAVGPSTSALLPRPTRLTVNLPGRMDRIFGREGDLQALAGRARKARLLTIVGPAGVGKSRVALEIAHDLAAEFPGGADFVDLSGLEDADRFHLGLAAALGIDPPAAGATDIALALRGQRRLLVFDNCEHLLHPLTCLVERIATAAPEVTIVATSRQALRAHHEEVHRLAPHALPDAATPSCREAMSASPAVVLFLHHAAAAGGEIDGRLDTVLAVAQMCRRLDGLALPIELAAMHAATHGIEATARGLGDRLSLFWAGRRTAPARQQTLRTSLDWSYRLLTEAERQVFERLSTLRAGPFSLQAAIEAGADDSLDIVTVATALDELCEKSLLWARDGAYRWTEFVRVYANERLQARHARDERAEPGATGELLRLPELRCVGARAAFEPQPTPRRAGLRGT